jgi:acetolactate synthase-1/2/3 large subunit
MPMDIMAREAEVNSEATAAMGPSPAPDPEMIAQAAKLLAAASKPMIVVGGGAADAAAEIQSIAEQLQAPVVAYQSGKGILSARHHLSVSPPIGHCLWKDTDVVLAVGTRLHPQQTAWGVDDRLKIVRIDIDPAEITRVRPPAVGIAGDARAALAALVRALAPHGCRASSEAGLTALKLRFAAEFAALEPQMSYLTAIRDVLPDDGIFVDELTQVGYVARFAFPVYRPRTYITSGYQGTLGYGFATALGAKVAHPDKPVVSISGDGGFLYNVPELATAVLHGIAVVAVVFADGAFGNVRRIQQTKYGGRVIATDLRNPDFVRLARDFGAAGARANTPEDLRRELRAAFERPGPTVIEVPVGEMPEPWHFIHMPRVRG